MTAPLDYRRRREAREQRRRLEAQLNREAVAVALIGVGILAVGVALFCMGADRLAELMWGL